MKERLNAAAGLRQHVQHEGDDGQDKYDQCKGHEM